MNKYRLSIMATLLVMVFLYMMKVVEVTSVSNFSFTCASLLFSISSVLDTYAIKNKTEERIKFVIDTLAIIVVVLLPSLKDEKLLAIIMSYFDSNILLLLSLFFTMASQWATEIKQKDMKNNKIKGENNGYKE